ncbi:hypothetical protein [Streptococcus sp. DD13]|uniref:hypothetical protein n=1 Tax=Streptococcus sp. DD13 TaxID=1777881 RepID=UPI000799CF60|nr:hypothetical protein [Streptococcus sp. DD13]KXT78263.1 MORN motif family protein [Streptococcus sp. DD13]
MDRDSLFDRIRPHLSRNRIEIYALVLIILCALSVFFVRMSSSATIRLDNGKLHYSGKMVANKMAGQGKLTFENGDVYEGQFSNGLFNGQGTFTSKTGWSYKGEFKNGVAEGQGTLTTEDNVVYKGTFKEGIYQNEN